MYSDNLGSLSHWREWKGKDFNTFNMNALEIRTNQYGLKGIKFLIGKR